MLVMLALQTMMCPAKMHMSFVLSILWASLNTGFNLACVKMLHHFISNCSRWISSLQQWSGLKQCSRFLSLIDIALNHWKAKRLHTVSTAS
jgi:hypothetical protein